MKSVFSFFVSILAVVSSVSYGEEPSFPVSATFTLGIQSELYKPRFNAVFNEKPVLTADLTVNFPAGFFAEVWGSYGTDDWAFDSNKGDEFDLFVGWKGSILDLDMKFSLNYVDFQPLSKSTGDLIVPSFSVSKTFALGSWNGEHTLRPEFRVDYVMSSDLERSSWVFLPSITHTWKNPFGLKQVSIYNQLTFHHSSSFGKFHDRSSLQWSGGVSWKISPTITLNAPTFLFATPLGDSHDGAKSTHVLGASITFAF